MNIVDGEPGLIAQFIMWICEKLGIAKSNPSRFYLDIVGDDPEHFQLLEKDVL